MIRDRIVAGWKVAKRAESKERIKEALNRFILEIRSSQDSSDISIDNLDISLNQSANRLEPNELNPL